MGHGGQVELAPGKDLETAIPPPTSHPRCTILFSRLPDSHLGRTMDHTDL
jgi:hypothetical protein